MVGKRNANRPLTDAERQAKSRLANGRGGHGQQTTICTSPPGLLTTLIPRGRVDLDSLERLSSATLVLYDRLVCLIENWISKVGDDLSEIDGFKAFALLAPALESLTILRGKIIEQRGSEAQEVTPRQPGAPPKIEQTLELLRSRFEGNITPKAT